MARQSRDTRGGKKSARTRTGKKGSNRRAKLAPVEAATEGMEQDFSAPLESETLTNRAWRDAQSMVGDELPGGTVAMPENNGVDDFAGALGVERAPDAPVRTSAEILDGRDRRRGGRRPRPSRSD
jgi:hypothetical protein